VWVALRPAATEPGHAFQPFPQHSGRLDSDMATQQECEAALRRLAERLDDVDESVRRKHAPDRTISCRIPDLGLSFSGRLRGGALTDLTDAAEDDPRIRDAQIRLTMSSDDLIAVTDGQLPIANAWVDGRVRVEASVLDLLKLRSLALVRQVDG
jgi:hypothetical protein